MARCLRYFSSLTLPKPASVAACVRLNSVKPTRCVKSMYLEKAARGTAMFGVRMIAFPPCFNPSFKAAEPHPIPFDMLNHVVEHNDVKLAFVSREKLLSITKKSSLSSLFPKRDFASSTNSLQRSTATIRSNPKSIRYCVR